MYVCNKIFFKFSSHFDSHSRSGDDHFHPFTLAGLAGAAGANAFPRASACFNVLYLPDYESKEQLERNLTIAIGLGVGMDEFPGPGPTGAGPAADARAPEGNPETDPQSPSAR